MKCFFAILFGLLGIIHASAQGFLNLNFEGANVSAYSPNDGISTNDAFPGWVVNFSGSHPSPPFIAYDALSLGGAGASINDTNTGFSFTPLAGRFSAFLFGGGSQSSTAISQLGLVPDGSQSIRMCIGNYYGRAAFTVTLNGQLISMIALSEFPTYTLFGGDVSAFVNQIVGLSITAFGVSPGPSPVLLDNIQFSSSSIPEPSAFALAALGSLLFGFRRWNR